MGLLERMQSLIDEATQKEKSSDAFQVKDQVLLMFTGNIMLHGN